MANPSKITLISLICFSFAVAFFQGDVVEANKIALPKTVEDWRRLGTPRIIDSTNIFKYMNGAGELYLGYRFNHLEVFDYTDENKNDILVELYFMETPDDAFGLLSLDWGGEVVSLGDPSVNGSKQPPASPVKALYGAGLLRIWSDNLYARVMALRETPASKQAVMTLGRAIVANRKSPPEPELLKALSPLVGSSWKLRGDRICFFRSYAVGLKIIEEKRKAIRGEPWPLSPPPICVEAADKVYGLGTSNLAEIKIEHYGWDKDLLL